MSVEYRKTKQGEVAHIRYRDKDGKQHRETLGLKSEGWTRRKAEEEETRRIHAAKTQMLNWDFTELAEKWFNETSRLRRWKPRTESAYLRAIERLAFFKNVRPAEVRPKHVADFIAQHPFSAKTTNFDVSVLYAIFDYAIRQEIIQSNPAAKAPRPKVMKKKWRILTPEEIQKVDAGFTNEKARLMFRVLTRTAIRRNELRHLRVKDIDFEKGIIRVTDSKTEEGVRSIAIPKSLAKELKEWCEK